VEQPSLLDTHMSLIEVRRLGKMPRIKIHYLAIDHLLGVKIRLILLGILKSLGEV